MKKTISLLLLLLVLAFFSTSAQISDELINKANNGDAEAMFDVGNLYALGQNGVPQDNDIAMMWFIKAANKGNTKAMCRIGDLYASGFGGSFDYSKAMKWYNKALENGNFDGMERIKQMALNGRNADIMFLK